jgi:hypothetical protein
MDVDKHDKPFRARRRGQPGEFTLTTEDAEKMTLRELEDLSIFDEHHGWIRPWRFVGGDGDVLPVDSMAAKRGKKR